MKFRGSGLLPGTPRLARAVFLIKFRSAKRPRSVTIRPPNVALYHRDDDSVHVEGWLGKRGFLNVDGDADGEVLDPILVGT